MFPLGVLGEVPGRLGQKAAMSTCQVERCQPIVHLGLWQDKDFEIMQVDNGGCGLGIG